VHFLQTPAGERRRQDLRARLALFADEMPHLFPRGQKVHSAIIPVILGTSEQALAGASHMAAAGFFVPAIRYPTVPKDRARLRLTFSARHTPEQVKALCLELAKLVPTFEVEDG
jgi:8-amino-7-oxononanoate synthase